MRYGLMAAMLGLAGSASAAKYIVYAGSSGANIGIQGYRFDDATGLMEPLGEMGPAIRPIFLTLAGDGKHLYAATRPETTERNPEGLLRAYAIGADHKLAPINGQPAKGVDPAYLAIDRTGKWLLNANYRNGSISVYPILPDGGIGEATEAIQYEGKGTDAARQAGPHAHSVVLTEDNKFALFCDLGLDKVFVYRFDAEHGKLIPGEAPFAQTPPGSGARHIKFSADEKFAYVTGEIKSNLTVFQWDAAKGTLAPVQTVSMLPDGFTSATTASELKFHPSGKWLYAANRGHDSIVQYAVDAATGKLTVVGWTPTGGKTPRQFALDPSGKWMLVGNQDSDEFVEFAVDSATGNLKPTAVKFPLSRPADFKFLPEK